MASEPFEIAFMDSSEASQLSALVDEVVHALPYYNSWAKRDETAKYTSTHLLEIVREDAKAVLVARQRGRLVGFLISRLDDGLRWLSWFGVHSDARRLGLGQCLLERMGSDARSEGIHKIWCDTRTENLASAALLQRVGFSRIATVENHWYGQDFHLWQWYP